jgi:NADPH:quinone reductase-like Zn-dependent oxidoreductase
VIRVVRSAVVDAPIERVWAVLRDFNSHTDWHPVVAESHIERGEPSDQVGCVRNFTLRDGHHIREQLLTLSDRDHVSTYCILDATLPMRRYVATVTLKRVTDGERTFWHWESTFDVPRGREREFADLVGRGVYEGGFQGLRAFLRRGGAARAAAGEAIEGRAAIVSRFGGPEVLVAGTASAAPPSPGEVRVRHTAIGVNYIDVYVRRGDHRMIEPPAVPGMEAAGVVVDVGDGVSHLLPGDRVAYACTPPGAYAEVRTLRAEQVVALPDEVSDETAAALMLKGLSAHYLTHRTHRVGAGDSVLVHAAAGGLGLLLCAWSKALGARVVGTASSEDKARLARAHGADDVIVVADGRFAASVRAATGGRGADVIFDGLGGPSRDENLDALATCGHWIAYGQAGGAHSTVDMAALSARSATLSRPVLFHYTATRAGLAPMAEALFAAIRAGILRAEIRHRYPLAGAADAHRDLEARRTVGQIVLLP